MILADATLAVHSDQADDGLDLHPTADEIDRALEDAYWADVAVHESKVTSV
jgi:hypothetical protein